MKTSDYGIRPGTLADLSLLAHYDFSFEVRDEIVDPFEKMDSVPLRQPYRKDYGFDETDLTEYLIGPGKQLFVAVLNDIPIGYLAISEGWNKYAVVEDVAVAAGNRQGGVGRLLMDAAVHWARDTGLAGVRLETQSTNISACRFYSNYGFSLGGYDRFLYLGLYPETREIALFWYLHF
ncbi:GNAT family N-acetyltransferase [Brucella cytisi]|jgi:streptothricin acetyltransferase|uniref:Streptothricin acetyltransferase n=1 Tax=Brucella cytisi TaxID=407152 RepID=A0A1J6I7E5_9HYPH|nr:GNAT family N-acetyltransferase [Brucella cytisi]OIS90888.1 streptothricin acetyltransferase [Brucella cytisi]